MLKIASLFYIIILFIIWKTIFKYTKVVLILNDMKNVGDVGATLRLSCGFALLGTGIIKKSPLMIAAGSTFMAQGITRFCPITYLLELSNDEDFNIKISKEFY